jgi:hypothetical protein
VDYFSYAPLFYAKRQPSDNPRVYDLEWMLTGDLDQDVNFIVKVDQLEANMEKYPTLQLLYEKNGFVFLKRKAHK